MTKKRVLLVLYIVIAISAAAAGYTYFLYSEGGENSYHPPVATSATTKERAESDLRNLSEAVEAYFIKNMEYPEKLELLIPEFVEVVGNDPASGKPYIYTLNDTANNSNYRIGVPSPALYNSKEFYIEDGSLFQK